MYIWICIPVFNRVQNTIECLESLTRQRYRLFHTIVCDDGSTDSTSDIIKKHYPDIHLLEGDGNLWWTGGINKCIEYVLKNCNEDDLILTLNNDLIIPEDYLENLYKAALRYPHSIITSVVYDIDNPQKIFDPGYRKNWVTTKSRSISIKKDHVPGDDDVAEITHASGRGTLIPVDVFRTIGLYDMKNLPHYSADYDLTHRARRHGYKIYISYKAKVYSYVLETGLTQYRQSISFRNFIHYLSDKKSSSNLKYRFRFALNNCPKYLLFSYILIDSILVSGSYFKYHFKKTLQNI